MIDKMITEIQERLHVSARKKARKEVMELAVKVSDEASWSRETTIVALESIAIKGNKDIIKKLEQLGWYKSFATPDKVINGIKYRKYYREYRNTDLEDKPILTIVK